MLRPYQEAALDAIVRQYAAGVRRQCVRMATGTGKTVLFANLPKRLPITLQGQQVLILAHRDTLIDQAADKVQHWNPNLRVSVEMGDRHADANADIVIASVPTLGPNTIHAGKRRSKFDWARFGVCVIDEAQHSSAETYQIIIRQGGFCDGKKLLLGVTATPQRKEGSLDQVYQEIVFDYPLDKATEDGWLVDLKPYTVHGGSNLDKVRIKGGDFNEKQLAPEVNTPARNQLIVAAWKDHAADRMATLAFCVDVQHALDMAHMFTANGIPAEAIWGENASHERRDKLDRLLNGQTKVLTNCYMLTEGFDAWEIDCVVLARPTKSPLLYQQMIGRGTRLQSSCVNLREEEKDGTASWVKQTCLLLDIVDNSSRHSLCTAPSLYGLNPEAEARGESLRQVAKQIRTHATVDFSRLPSLDAVEKHVEEVNLFSKKKPPVSTKKPNFYTDPCTPRAAGYYKSLTGHWPPRGTTGHQLSLMIQAIKKRQATR